MLRELARQSTWYLIVHILGTLLTLARVPIWTRYFTVQEYGWLSLLTATTAFVGPIARLGLPRSVLRFFSEFTSGKRGPPMSSFYTTFFLGCVGLGTIMGLLFFALVLFLGPEHTGGQELYELYKLICVLLIVGSVPAMFVSFLRVEQKAKLFAWLGLGRQFVGFSVSLILMFGFFVRLKGLYIGSICIQTTTAIVMLVVLLRQKKLVPSTFSRNVLMDGLRFGLPLVPAALANVISGIGDRYVLQILMGPEAVGLYSVGYGVTTHLKSLLTVMMFAVTPMYLAIWDEKGRQPTESFLSSVLDYYLMATIPAIFLFSVYGGDVMVLLASSKYEMGKVIIPYLAGPLLLHGGITIYTAGLYIQKKTKYILYFTLGAGGLNVILNIFMIPAMGLVGAAVATLISYVFLMVFAIFLSSRFLTIKVNFISVAKYIVASVGALGVLHFVKMDFSGAVVPKLLLGVLLYGIAIFVLDERVREKSKLILSNRSV